MCSSTSKCSIVYFFSLVSSASYLVVYRIKVLLTLRSYNAEWSVPILIINTSLTMKKLCFLFFLTQFLDMLYKFSLLQQAYRCSHSINSQMCLVMEGNMIIKN